MRLTRVVAFSVPPDFEAQILKHAKLEHRTISEYVREAVRNYMMMKDFDTTHKKVSKRMKKNGLRSSP